MFKCTCCLPPKEYTHRKGLYKHQRRYDPNYIDPLLRADVQRRAEYEKENRRCVECDAPIPFEDRETKLKFCSQTCAAVYNNRTRASFVCECCEPPQRFKTINALGAHTNKRPATKRRNKPKIKNCLHCGAENTSRYASYCSLSCDRERKHIDRVQAWLSGKHSGGNEYAVSPFVRRYLFEKYDSKCSICGWNKINPQSGNIPLQVDHIDGNPLNNAEENLRLLCPNCHSLTPTYGALNKGNGRAYRRQRYAEGKSF